MKKILALILALLMLALPLASCDTDTPKDTDVDTSTPETDTPDTNAPETEAPTLREGEEDLFVGYGRACLTPYNEDGSLMDVTLAGYADKRPVKTVKDDLFASCTAFKDKDGNIALLYSLDLHSMQPENAKTLQKAVEKATGVPEENIFFNVTHTHAAPHITQFMDFVKEKVAEAGKAAIDDLTLVSGLYTGVITAENMNFIRRYSYDSAGRELDHLWNNDPAMPVVRFIREGDKKDVILANWAAHCDTVKTNNATTVSADYVSYFRSKIEGNIDAYVSLHMAASGDVNPMSKLANESKFLGTVKYGEKLADYLLDNLGALERQEIKSEVKAKTEKIKVAYDHTEDDRGEDAVKVMTYYWDVAGSTVTQGVKDMVAEYGFESIYEAISLRIRYTSPLYDRISVGALSIGNVVFGIAPYEMFTVNGKNIKDSADEFDLAFMCAYTNGMLGYIAAEEAFEYDIYEVYSRRYTKETATLLQDSIIAIIDELGK